MEKGKNNMADETKATIPNSDMDGGWKEVIDDLTEDFFKFYFPDIHKEIDFSQGVENLDTKLNQIIGDGDNIKRDADKLLKVTLLNGQKQTLYVHIEIQSYPDPTFEKRMFTYFYRIYDKYDEGVMSLAVLVDGNKNFRPTSFTIKHFGFKMEFEFPMVKLIDYDENELKNVMNPFAVVTRVQLAQIRIKKEDKKAVYNFKRNLIIELEDTGYDRDTAIKLIKFIDYVLTLSEEDDIKLKKELEEYEETQKVSYVTSFERLAKQEGQIENARESILEVLKEKFTDIPYKLNEAIMYCDDLAKLKALLRKAAIASSIDEISV